MKSWVYCEQNKVDAELLKVYLKKAGIYYEASGCYGRIHFSIHATTEEVAAIDNWIDNNLI